MARKPETIFKEQVLKDLKVFPNGYFEKIQQVGKRGTPDILGCLNGYAVVIELKKDAKAKPDKLQVHKLKQYQRASALVFVACPATWGEIYKRLTIISTEGQYANADHRREVERRLFAEEESF
jgi:Holliday junction resolvase